MMSKTYDCDSMLCKCYVHQDCVKGGPSVRTRLSASLDIGNEPSSCRTSAVLLLVLTPATVGVGDNCAILDFSQRHLTGHSWTYLRNFWFCRIFFCAKLPPRTAKTVFENPKGPPFGC